MSLLLSSELLYVMFAQYCSYRTEQFFYVWQTQYYSTELWIAGSGTL